MDNAIFNGETDAELLLRLAELMEQGSIGKRQITGQYFEIDGNGVCAIGAMLAAVGMKPQPSDQVRVMDVLQITTWPKVMFPADAITYERWSRWANPHFPMSLPDAIIGLNDCAGWRFSQIIQWMRETAAQATITSKDA